MKYSIQVIAIICLFAAASTLCAISIKELFTEPEISKRSIVVEVYYPNHTNTIEYEVYASELIHHITAGGNILVIKKGLWDTEELLRTTADIKILSNKIIK
jgi:hypothetical protein